MNKGDIPSLDTVKEQGMRAPDPDQLELLAESEGALVLDTRAPQTFRTASFPARSTSASAATSLPGSVPDPRREAPAGARL